MTDHSDLIEASVVPMSEHIERFWRYLETETVRVLVDLRREMGNGCVYHDSSSFPDDVAKALVADRKAQSLSLSKARAENDRKDLEIERLRADIAVKAKLLTKSAKETRAFWDALIPKGGRCRDCADFDGRCQGGGPPCDPQAHALENLAKLQAASPALSSLRKGAEVAVRKLRWSEPDALAAYPEWRAHEPSIKFSAVIDTSRALCFGKFPLTINGLTPEAKFETLYEAKAYAQANFETRIRSALVSGSREDGE